jgi:ABC-type polysaccharide/polyol phosphate transport system ATPase subunit
VQGISFEVPCGEGLGIIGENGAGKSTLLKILAGITAPTAGDFRTNGTVASILELGSAFHGELTGRQNIVLNAAMFGLDRAQVVERTPHIIDFSELGEFIDRPIKTYSTGMVMRLGFAIATQVEPDVLIIDEALSVGDGYFQKKCMVNLRRHLDRGGTLLLCSHAMYYISAFCNRVIWMREGRIEQFGPAQQVVPEYEGYLQAKTDRSDEKQPVTYAGPGSPARLTGAEFIGEKCLRQSDPIAVNISWRCEDPDLSFHICVGLNRMDEVVVASFLSKRDGVGPWSGAQEHRISLEIPTLPLIKGGYKLYIFLLAEDALHIYDTRILDDAFRVEFDEYPMGIVDIDHTWRKREDG